MAERKITEEDRLNLIETMKAKEAHQAGFIAAVKQHDLLMGLYRRLYGMKPEEQIRYQDGVIMSPEPAPDLKLVEKGAKPKAKEA